MQQKFSWREVGSKMWGFTKNNAGILLSMGSLLTSTFAANS